MIRPNEPTAPAKAGVRVADEIGAAGDMLPTFSASSLIDQCYVVYSMHPV